MNGIAISGSDTLVLNNYLFQTQADQNIAELTFPNDIAQVKTGKNGNSIFGLNQTGLNGELKMRLLRASADDIFMLSLLNQQIANFAGTVLLQGQLVKKLGDGAGNITSDTYIISGGVFIKIPEVKTNVEGDTEQSVTVYTMKFAQVQRVLT